MGREATYTDSKGTLHEITIIDSKFIEFASWCMETDLGAVIELGAACDCKIEDAEEDGTCDYCESWNAAAVEALAKGYTICEECGEWVEATTRVKTGTHINPLRFDFSDLCEECAERNDDDFQDREMGISW